MKITLSLLVAIAAVASFAQCADCGKKANEASSQCAAEGAKPFDAKDAEFLALASAMTKQADGGKEMCCKSTASKPMAKGDKGCCNEKGIAAKFKVFVAGQGYQFFGCEDSAAEGRAKAIASGRQAGRVQKVTSKRSRIS